MDLLQKELCPCSSESFEPVGEAAHDDELVEAVDPLLAVRSACIHQADCGEGTKRNHSTWTTRGKKIMSPLLKGLEVLADFVRRITTLLAR